MKMRLTVAENTPLLGSFEKGQSCLCPTVAPIEGTALQIGRNNDI